MSRTPHDSPYRDDPKSPRAAPAHTNSRPARKSNRSRQQDKQRKPQSGARDAGRHAARSAPAHSANGPRASHPQPRSHAHSHPSPVVAATAAPPARRRSRRRGRGGGGPPSLQLTSHPTGRAAYADTRAWLLKEHGPICAYCARQFAPEVMTLDHVAPRRGLTAYDRRDNLVLACRPCNEAKRDLSPLAYLLAVRSRAANLLRYGAHLSPGLLDLARSLMPKSHHHHEHAPSASNGNGGNGKRSARETFGIIDEEGESPYKE